MKNFKYAILIFVCLCSCVLTACTFSPKEKMTISGFAYLNSEPLSDVTIKTKTQTLAKTKSDGSFSFEKTKTTLIIHVEKKGYTFTPSEIEVTETKNDIIFVAEPIKNLNGTLNLKEINLTPTSIVSISDNYAFTQNNKKGLKIKGLKVNINDKTVNCIQKTLFAEKNKIQKITFNDDISIKTGINFNINFSLDTFFTSNSKEYEYNEDKYSTLTINEPQTTADLNSKNQVIYTFLGVNSTNNKFTYDISFIFDFYENI